MKHKNNRNQSQIPAGEPRSTVVAGPARNIPTAKETDNRAYLSAGGKAPNDFVPSPDEVARRAYFAYVNQGSLPGHDVRHWLEAESQLLAERDLTRVHGYDDRHKINFQIADHQKVKL
jgi:hypothetical protein